MKIIVIPDINLFLCTAFIYYIVFFLIFPTGKSSKCVCLLESIYNNHKIISN